MDDSVDLTRAARIINSLEPDLVALQEIDSVTERTRHTDQAAVLGSLTDMHAVFGDFMEYQGGKYGMALLSRHPIEHFQNHRLPGNTEPRSVLTALVRHASTGTEMLFVGIHLYSTAQERLAQAQTLVDLMRDTIVPVILAGDFNSTPESEVIDLLRHHWHIPDKGDDNFTFPSIDPDREIDFIMFRPRAAFEILESRVIHEPLASDHRPVLLTLRLSVNDELEKEAAISTDRHAQQ
jgi:endonuclease/exonuclease/phosphatase family metal-dependent hydrolase